jgi:hypothetical protein
MYSFLPERRGIIRFVGDIEDYSVPAILADQCPVNSQQNLLPWTELLAAMRAGVIGLVRLSMHFLVVFAVFGQNLLRF